MANTHEGIYLANNDGTVKEYGNNRTGEDCYAVSDNAAITIADTDYFPLSSSAGAKKKTLLTTLKEKIAGTKAEREDVATIITTGSTNTTGSQINSGTYFYLNGTLCKAIANIATNATYTLNTNFSVVSMGEELRLINQNLVAENLYNENGLIITKIGRMIHCSTVTSSGGAARITLIGASIPISSTYYPTDTLIIPTTYMTDQGSWRAGGHMRLKADGGWSFSYVENNNEASQVTTGVRIGFNFSYFI